MATLPFLRVLREGSSGPDVSAVKSALQAWHPGVISNVTEVYGPGAVNAVKAFQRTEKLTEDGVYGPVTHQKLTPFFNPAARSLYLKGARPRLVRPVPAHYLTGASSVHPTLGLPGYPAIDFFAAAHSPVIAPERSRVERFSGHDPRQGPVAGPHGPLGWSIYLLGSGSGTSYFLTHLDSRTCLVGATVELGEEIGTVADYLRYGTPSHTHVGVSGGSVSIRQLGAAPLWA